MDLPPGIHLRLAPEDEYLHPPSGERNYNESMYFNLYDAGQRVGGWFRLGNRVNEGHAEMTNCLYLPDGSVAFMFRRPEIAHNEAFDAGGMRFAVAEPFKRLSVHYRGEVLLLRDPGEMIDPGRAFRNNPRLPCAVDIDYRGVSPMYGGEPVHADGSPWRENPNAGLYAGHYEQHIAGTGRIRVGDREWQVRGLGLRDHSWGPRYWQNVPWYRWLPMSFSEDFAIMLLDKALGDGRRIVGGMVLSGGRYDLVREVRVESEWDANFHQTRLRAWARTDGAEYRIEGRVLALIPLRNRRTLADGTELLTRITEGLTEYRCNGQVGYGLSEYLDQIVDGRPVGVGA
ncbi:MAG: DUF7064 domain-containing protein [Pseudomonadota bacterium]